MTYVSNNTLLLYIPFLFETSSLQHSSPDGPVLTSVIDILWGRIYSVVKDL